MVSTFANAPSDSLFSTDLVTTLVSKFWDEYFNKVVWRCLIPFLIYFLSTSYYFSVNIINKEFYDSDEYKPFDLTLEFFNRVITIFGMIYFGVYECV